MHTIKIGKNSVVVSEVLSSYWYFAAERQHIYYARLNGESAPWTSDPVISRYRFTNAYRAADRVSQELIHIIYDGPQTPSDLLVRVLLFRFFNKPSTWNLLEDEIGEINSETFSVARYGAALDRAMVQGRRIYSGAYIIPPPPFGAPRKHQNHLLLIEQALRAGLHYQLADAPTLKCAYEAILSYPSLGPFLAYQLAIDFNYTPMMNFDENDFVVAGPGARSGIAKCFPVLAGLAQEDVIRWMVDIQHEAFAEHGLEFDGLFGRPLALIDCQNLFCETDKYARVRFPNVPGVGGRARIKQHFLPAGSPKTPFFPPKWGINDQVPHRLSQSAAPKLW
jgi:alpha-glutamyl/putrescinyl thymine pyrophosphorylase clade 1